ncbi:sulfite exporter TauE/SafE family protein [Sandaracinus amylolyticus]|uniref:urease accessory protein UreH domain-containing protein n=1 Tax=Sandaracinus amylolyticus TaxID=927083 RepID=UPI001F48EC9C|nr:sulfite exporter TauE/SafE family protein [Sandaracinus amylolyticus]UJR79452.1 Putative membrane copper tolerance protein [Sandaracinus amylolyticus]
MIAALLAGLALGVVSAPHCLGMCGPLAAFAAMPPPGASTTTSAWRPLRWQLGRLAAYAMVGGAAGALGAQALRALAPSSWAGAALSFTLAAALLLSAVRLWAPRWWARSVDVGAARLTRGRANPSLTSRLLARAPREPFVLGAISALLPCGALWSGAIVAAGAGSIAAGAVAMIGFASASGAALAFAGAIGARAQTSLAFRRSLAAVLAVGALITVLRPLPSLRDGASTHASCHVE